MLGINEERVLELHSGPDPASALLALLHPLLQADGWHFSTQLPSDTPALSDATILGSVTSGQRSLPSLASILTCSSHFVLNYQWYLWTVLWGPLLVSTFLANWSSIHSPSQAWHKGTSLRGILLLISRPFSLQLSLCSLEPHRYSLCALWNLPWGFQSLLHNCLL